ncbi:MAG: ATP-binding protein [Candidatus Aenigmarchaeota archaeon]|nr:ATP-binding protein [Candidatus Aenigmarchaeota archaeon]MDI6721954.1 ATP-binding protein [Candidatus Aenigmarchaeota archaeon]
MDIVGQIVDGSFAEIIVRQKYGKEIEIGDLFVAETSGGYTILEAFDLVYGSQLGQQARETVSGLRLEGHEGLTFFEEGLTNYSLAKLKPVVYILGGTERMPKSIPPLFSSIRPLEDNDMGFLKRHEDSVKLGCLRSGSKRLSTEIFIQGRNMMSHHILVPATTGRGKSNLVKVMVSSILKTDFCSMLIFDPHDEYYGRNGKGLKDVADIIYYSVNPETRGRKLLINIKNLRPSHLDDLFGFTDPQVEAMWAFYNKYENEWVERMLSSTSDEVESMGINPASWAVLQRRFGVVLGIRKNDSRIECSGIFSNDAGMTTINDICISLENEKSVIVDTSLLSNDLEVFVSSLAAKEIFSRYKRHKMNGELDQKPIVSIVLEEAVRFLNADAVQKGNIFSTIAREGRKFKIGLLAVTQLPSLIPKEILANINTKIILGTELASERNAIIESAAQDLSRDDRNIASLDRGEAIITSNFTKFAVPVCIPLFEDVIEEKTKTRKGFLGMGYS